MAIELDHVIVSARNQRASARRLGELLDVPWAEHGIGPFSPVYVNDGLTLDFIDDDSQFPVQHLCFRVDGPTFDAVLSRLESAGIPYRSNVHGPQDMQVNTSGGYNVAGASTSKSCDDARLAAYFQRQRELTDGDVNPAIGVKAPAECARTTASNDDKSSRTMQAKAE